MNRIATLAAAIGLATICSQPALAQMDHSSMKMEQMSAASTAYMDAMKQMDDDMAGMKMTGKPGADFAIMMIPHHQAAIDMAKAYLDSGEADPQLTKLSNEIIAAQESEIALLKAWLKKNGY
jgi:uncharacterized protein (DUF305 family)